MLVECARILVESPVDEAKACWWDVIDNKLSVNLNLKILLEILI